jgi:hypothetical protein
VNLSLTLYFLRHRETIYSETGAYRGEVDAELTPEGAQMAEAFAKAVSTAPIGIWGVFLRPSSSFSVPLGAGIAQPDPARLAQSRAAPRLGQGRLLRAAGPDQRLRAVGAPALGSSTAERDVNQSIIGLHCIIHSLPLALKGPSSQ